MSYDRFSDHMFQTALNSGQTLLKDDKLIVSNEVVESLTWVYIGCVEGLFGNYKEML